MCGIAGIINIDSSAPVDESVLKRMCDVIRHRGPDDEGFYLGNPDSEGRPQAGLGMRRLSIIDLETGHQPIHNQNKTIWVVLNGEIYNFRELRSRLEEKGHKFYTRTDTEVIVHLYEDYGRKCVDYLRGMYAFALWDERKKRFMVARDRLGKKPLYYTLKEGKLIFASEIKSILEYPGIERKINLRAINSFLTLQYIPSPMTIFEGIKRLEPASTMTCNFHGHVQTERYWNITYRSTTKLSFGDACEQLRSILTESTKLRLISDVPLGAFLSGGHDSSIIVALMSKLMPKSVKTFSIGFKEQDFSELGYARAVARKYKTDHHELMVEPDFIDILPKIVWHYDQPYADSSALPSYYVANMTRPHVTVALNGDGGDENFAGYLRYRAMKGSGYIEWPFKMLGGKLTGKLSSLIPHTESGSGRNIFRYIYRFTSALSNPPELRHIIWHAYFTNEAKYHIYSTDMMKSLLQHNAYDYLADTFRSAPAGNIMDKSFYTDIMTYLPEDLLVKMDVATMANSLETRSPFLDHKLVEFASTIPHQWKMKGFSSKYILKKAFGHLLPKEIINRPKQGFGIPLGKWFRGEWKDYFRDTVLSREAVERGYFNKQNLEELFNEHVSGRKDHGYRMYALLVLELWHRVFIDRSVEV